MKKIFIMIIVLICMATASAQDKKSQFEVFSEIKTLTASFTQTNHYSGLDNFTREGKVYIIRPERALWDYADPAEYYLLETAAVYHYSGELAQLIKLNVNPKDINDPTGILLGIFLDSSTIKTRFDVDEKPDIITLTPKSNIGMDSIIIRMQGNTLKSISSKDSGGNSILINFTDIVTGKTIPEKIFDKRVPEGTSFYEQ